MVFGVEVVQEPGTGFAQDRFAAELVQPEVELCAFKGRRHGGSVWLRGGLGKTNAEGAKNAKVRNGSSRLFWRCFEGKHSRRGRGGFAEGAMAVDGIG